MTNSNYLMDHLLYQNFEHIMKKYEILTNNSSIIKYNNKIQNRIISKIKTGYYLDLLTPEKMKLLGSIGN